MSYFSIEFALLLLVFFAFYWLLPRYTQKPLLLAFNYLIIYCFSHYFALVLFIYTMLVYFLSLLIDTARAKFVFLVCVLACVLFLCFFKFYAFIKDDFDWLLQFIGFGSSQIDIVFPLGLSFYTFASITYLRNVYESSKNALHDESYEEGNENLESFLALSTYLSFFPTLLAGPIMRSDYFFEQYHSKREFKHINLILALILFGVVKKTFLANYLEIYSKPILNNPQGHSSLELFNAISAYSIQLYADFSGYVNLVCAFALMLGFSLPINFNMPYAAKNLKDFWNRWHISLSSFIKDYIYIPLGGNRRGFVLTQIFVLFSFAISGIWHGNSINFLIWGVLHGIGIVWLNVLKALNLTLEDNLLDNFLGSIFCMIFVIFCWIFFYYPTLEEALDFLNSMLKGIFLPVKLQDIIIFCSFTLCFIFYPLSKNLLEITSSTFRLIPHILKPLILAPLIVLIVYFIPAGIPNFIYASF